MLAPLTDHPADDLLERYSLERLDGSDLAFVEEHLLVCHWCQDRLAEIDRFIAAMRDASREDEGANSN